MPSPVRFALVAALAIACHGALAQTVVPPGIAVQRIAPQLVAFAGSQANFQNLVTGLAQGTQIQLLTVLPDGFTQLVTFTPAAPLSAEQIAQVLERTRQQLIGLGIATPTAEQLAVALMGGVVPTAVGGSQVAGVLGSQAPSAAVQAQTNIAAGGATSASPATATTSVTPPVNIQVIPGATSRSPVPATPAPPGADARGANSRSAAR